MQLFSKRFQRIIRDKIKKVADSLPVSLRLNSVQPIRNQEELGFRDELYELDVGKGPRVAFVLYRDRQLMVIYMIGTHDYAMQNYLKLASERLLKQPS